MYGQYKKWGMRALVPVALVSLVSVCGIVALMLPVAQTIATGGGTAASANLTEWSSESFGQHANVARPTLSPPENRPQTVMNVSYTYRRLPAQPGVIEVTMQLPVTTEPQRFSIRPQDSFTVVATSNISNNGSTYEWSGEEPAEMVYRLPFDWSYTGNRADSWTLLEHRPPSIRAESAVDIQEQITIAGDGYVGNRTLLLGAYESYERTANGERINLIIPDGVSLLYGPNRTVDALANSSRALRIGERNEVVHAFATPEIETQASFVQPGFALDSCTILVDADSELDVWTHEYVHTRQAFPETEGLEWLVEGSATYYGWLLSIQQGYDDWAPLNGVLSRGADNSILAEPETWSGESDYKKGTLVLWALDRKIRLATDGDRTVQDVIRSVNMNRSDPNLSTLITAVRQAGGPDAAAAAERYLTTENSPEYQLSRDQFADIYSYDAPQIQIREINVSAAGRAWTRSLGRQDGQFRLGLNETLRVTARVTNAGDATGVASLAPQVSDEEGILNRVDSPWIARLTPATTVNRTATHQFDRPGTYELTVDGRSYSVTVVPDRGTASVTQLNASYDPTDERVVINVTVRNEGNSETFVTLPVSFDGKRVATIGTVLDRDASHIETVRINASGPMPDTIAAGTVETTVSGLAATDTSGPGSVDGEPTSVDGETPGGKTLINNLSFSVLGILSILVLLVIVALDEIRRR